VSEEQRSRYCRYVIGQPALFVLRLMTPGRIDDAGRDDALVVSELIQMANITRDIERDLARDVAYHPDLREWLGQEETPMRNAAVLQARRALLVEALVKVPAFGRLLRVSALPFLSRARGSAILMLLFTERYYRGAVLRVGGTGWPGRNTAPTMYARALRAAGSPGQANREVARVEANFLAAARELRGGG
jgi:phytoene/squalene synthetase